MFYLQYVSEVVIGAPYAVTADLMDHFKVLVTHIPFSKNVFLPHEYMYMKEKMFLKEEYSSFINCNWYILV